jgi:ecotin
MSSGKVLRIVLPRWSRFLSLYCLLAFTASSLLGADASPNAGKELKAFPKAGEGMVRFVIMLPPQTEENLLKVELLIGKRVMLDARNRYFFGGRLESETIPGWGYDRYVLKSLGPMAGTLMAVDPQAPKVERFITLGGEPQLLRYNSRLPMVIYVPKGVEVRYRLWNADQKTLKATEN